MEPVSITLIILVAGAVISGCGWHHHHSRNQETHTHETTTTEKTTITTPGGTVTEKTAVTIEIDTDITSEESSGEGAEGDPEVAKGLVNIAGNLLAGGGVFDAVAGVGELFGSGDDDDDSDAEAPMLDAPFRSDSGEPGEPNAARARLTGIFQLVIDNPGVLDANGDSEGVMGDSTAALEPSDAIV
ncbi:MAG: hypothetical protein COA94_07270 [Rickettsiales bacterium]|nr:MAG: hypothetical protein COA94_07270 [Rickettsiales bacterium]